LKFYLDDICREFAESRAEEFACIPGFYDTSGAEWYEDYYAVSTATGNLAWTIMTLGDSFRDGAKVMELWSRI